MLLTAAFSISTAMTGQMLMKTLLSALFVALPALMAPASAQTYQSGTIYTDVNGNKLGNVAQIYAVPPQASGLTVSTMLAQLAPGRSAYFILYPGIQRAGYASIPISQFSNYQTLYYVAQNCSGQPYMDAVNIPARAWLTSQNGNLQGSASVTAWFPQPPFQVTTFASAYGPASGEDSTPVCINGSFAGLAGVLTSVPLNLPGPQDGSQLISLNP
jgi:hypothetical protein